MNEVTQAIHGGVLEVNERRHAEGSKPKPYW